MGMRTLSAILAAAALMGLAACSGAGAASGAPSPRSLLAKIPGCSRPYTPAGGVAVQASAEQECVAPGYVSVDVATFTSASLERQWIIAQQAGVCSTIQGHHWAALVMAGYMSRCAAEGRIARALGGRMVSP